MGPLDSRGIAFTPDESAQDVRLPLPLATAPASPVASPSASPVAPFVSGGTKVPSLEDTMDASIVVAELDGYAGHYPVPERQYMPVYLWVGDMGGLAATLTDLLGEDAAFEIHPAARTFTELQTIVDGVRELYPEFYARDMLIVSSPRTSNRTGSRSASPASSRKPGACWHRSGMRWSSAVVPSPA